MAAVKPSLIPTAELGHVVQPGWLPNAGHNALGWGWPLDPSEEAAAWQWPTSIETADRMSRHPQIAALWWAITLPLRGDIWALDPQEADPERVQLLAEDLDLPVLDERGERQPRPPTRRRGRFSWPEHVRIMLLHLRWGSMFFETVYDREALAETGMARLRKLAPRFPRTISRVVVSADGGLDGIRQWGSGHKEIAIPVDRLVAYVHDREGANWTGRSMWRALYRPFELADRLERVEAMTGERNGMGIPTAEVVPGWKGDISQAAIDAAAEVAQAWRAGDYSGAAMPPGFRIRLAGVEGTLPDLDKPISRHYGLMAKAVQAMFMELGSTQGGHRALGETFVEQFEAAVGGLASSVASDVMTPHIVEDWWDLNFGPDDPAPAVVVSPGEVPVESVIALVEAGLVVRDDALEDWLRDRLRLPARSAAAPPPGNLSFLSPPTAAGRRVRAATPSPWADRLAEAFAAAVDPGAIAAAARSGEEPAAAVDAGIAADLSDLEAVLAELWTEGYSTGQSQAAARLKASARPRPTAATLASLLGHVRDLVASVVGSLRDRLVDAVASAGELEAEALADMVATMVSDPVVAERIALTESHRALVAGAVDTWEAAGVERFRWVQHSGETDECADRDGQDDAWDDLPPLHPNCRCTVEPA